MACSFFMRADIDAINMSTMLVQFFFHRIMNILQIVHRHQMTGNSTLICNNNDEPVVLVQFPNSFYCTREKMKFRPGLYIIALRSLYVDNAITVQKNGLSFYCLRYFTHIIDHISKPLHGEQLPPLFSTGERGPATDSNCVHTNCPSVPVPDRRYHSVRLSATFP